MNDSHIVSISQIKEFSKVAKDIEFQGAKKKEKYEWINNVLVRFKYSTLKKKDKSIVKNYIIQMTGYSDAQITRLIEKKKKFGKVFLSSTKRHRFEKIYTPSDVANLAKTDEAHSRLSGPATKRIFEKEFTIFKKLEFERLNRISVSHLYNLRGTRQYQTNTKFFVKTKPTKVAIGERRRPEPNGEPGYLRVDSVHQGDLEREKGVYHINLVDEITQWEIVGAVEKISERYLEKLLADLISQFPFKIRSFHSDNGGEFINKLVAGLLNKLLIQQTKSRSRHCNDNALVEGKNGSVIRKHMGYIHIGQRHAELINEFYKNYLNIYLNYHRPCGFATTIIDKKGKQKKVYNIYHTPYEALESHLNASKFLKEGISFEKLDMVALKQSDNEFAELMQKAKDELFKNFKTNSKNSNSLKGQNLQLPMTYTTFISGSYVD